MLLIKNFFSIEFTTLKLVYATNKHHMQPQPIIIVISWNLPRLLAAVRNRCQQFKLTKHQRNNLVVSRRWERKRRDDLILFFLLRHTSVRKKSAPTKNWNSPPVSHTRFQFLSTFRRFSTEASQFVFFKLVPIFFLPRCKHVDAAEFKFL